MKIPMSIHIRMPSFFFEDNENDPKKQNVVKLNYRKTTKEKNKYEC